ncbi:MAG TPA: CHASE3 domain-containing protein [Opitutaceae bacterium]|nr:CHASE3 domain-containing protein [Opitutaceae bacterium]
MSTDGPNPAGTADPSFRRLLVILGLILAVLAFVVVESLRNLNRSIAASDWVNHTHAVINEVEAIETSLQAAEGALRTCLLTGDPRDHETCQEAFSDLAGHVDVAHALTKGAPQQSQEVMQIETLLERRAGLARQLLRARAAGSSATVSQLLADDAGGAAVHEIIRRLQHLKDEQNDLLAAQDTASYLQAQTTRWTVLTGTGLDILLLGGAAWLIWDDLAARRRAAAVLEDANKRLEARVRERTAELKATNDQLVAQNLEDRWAHQALEHQLRYSQLIINSISDLVLVVTKPLHISRLNPAVTHLTGWTAADLVDQPLARVVQLEPAKVGAELPLTDPIAQALADGRDLRSQPAVVTNRQGGTTPVRLDAFPLRDRDQVVGGVIILQGAAVPPRAT